MKQNEKKTIENNVDYEEQYQELLAEEKEAARKKTYLVIFLSMIIILLAMIGATFSYIKLYANANDNNKKIGRAHV